MRAIVTVIGKDHVGIIADVTALLAQYGVNVLDISQTVLQEYFTMIMLVDASQCTVPFADLARTLDEAAIGMVNNKTTAVRIIPAPGKHVGDTVAFGGLLGSAPVMPVNRCSAADFIARGGRIPAPLHSLKN